MGAGGAVDRRGFIVLQGDALESREVDDHEVGREAPQAGQNEPRQHRPRVGQPLHGGQADRVQGHVQEPVGMEQEQPDDRVHDDRHDGRDEVDRPQHVLGRQRRVEDQRHAQRDEPDEEAGPEDVVRGDTDRLVEQRVLQLRAQAAQRMAHRRLGQPHAPRRARDVALGPQGVEGEQQIEVERLGMHIIHGSR